MGKEPQALLNGFEERPILFAEVGHHLMEMGFVSQAVRWLDEAVRHLDAPLFRVQLAACYALNHKLAAETADQLAKAEQLGWKPPFPGARLAGPLLKILGPYASAHPFLSELAALTVQKPA